MKKRLNIALIALLVICLVYCYWLNITLAKAKTITELRDNAIYLSWMIENYQAEYKDKQDACNKQLEEIHNNADYARALKEEVETKLDGLGFKLSSQAQ